ncbi:MAG: hypothetical protein RLZZ270_1104 [Actinomycetota bacterium]|jgi:hypothetical protein
MNDQLIGIYDADATIIGEVSYWIGARLGLRHCSLCDVTHGLVSEKASWRACKEDLPLPFVTFHRNDMPDDVRALVDNALPAVVMRRSGTVTRLLSANEIEAAKGSPDRLAEMISERLGAQ